MKYLIPILFLFLFCRNLSGQEGLRITWDYSSQSFNEFVRSAERNLNVKFFYQDEWVKDIKPGEFQGAETITGLFERLFNGRSLFWYADDSGNIIITRNFSVKVGGRPEGVDKNFIPPTEYYDNRASGQLSGNVVQEIGNPADKSKQGNVTITGYITNRDTKEPVAGVTIFVQKLQSGTISNQYGFYSLTLPRGSHLLQYSYIGMKEKQIGINLYGQGELNVEMNSVLIPLRETVVTAQRNMTLQRTEVGLEKISVSAFKLMPTPMGEADIIKSVLLIPGVQSVGEGSAGFNVRGGSADQNLVLLYGAPVYNTSHFFGFFSAVNADIIREVTIYKGGIPGRYGGRISSVLDISGRDGNRKEFAGNAGISPITTHLLVEGPVKKDTSTFLFAGRTTYSNWILDVFDIPALRNSRASFYDINSRFTYDFSRKDKFDISGYSSHDSFRFNSDTVYSYNNLIVSGRWRHFFSNRLFSVLSFHNSFYRYDVTSESNPPEAFALSHTINSSGLKYDFNYYQGRHEFNFGTEAAFHSVLPGKYYPAGDSSLVIPDRIERERAIESGFYAEDKFAVTENLSVNAGIRFSSYFALGEKSVMVYDPELSRSLSTIYDTLSYRPGQIYRSYGGPELRLSFNYRLSTRSSVKVNYNRMRQYLHLLSNSTSISPTDTWKLSDYYIKPQIGDQYAAGFYQVMNNLGIEASLEIYYKTLRNMVDFKGGTNLVMDRYVEKDLVNVKGKAYGVELSLKKEEGRIRWSFAYTYSRTFLKSTGRFADEIINSGKWFPANFDRPHDLLVTFNYILSRRFSISSGYTYSTGRPITYPETTYYLNDMLVTYYSDRNKYRLPDYSRLDISWTINGNLKAKKIAHPHWVFSIYNVLGRNNVYSVYFNQEASGLTGYKLSVFARAIPSISFNFDF